MPNHKNIFGFCLIGPLFKNAQHRLGPPKEKLWELLELSSFTGRMSFLSPTNIESFWRAKVDAERSNPRQLMALCRLSTWTTAHASL